jgi:hypothetical protein
MLMAEDELPTLEYGRYRLWKTPDGGWLLARAAFTCDRCQSCGCGEKQDHVTVAGMMVRLAEAAQNGGGGSLGMMRRLIGRGRRDDGTGDSGGAETAEGSDPAGGDLAGLLAAGLSGQEGGGGSGDGGEGTPGPV